MLTKIAVMAGFVGVALLTPACATAPNVTATDCGRFGAILSGLDGSNPEAIAALLDATPTACPLQRNAIEMAKQRIGQSRWFVASDDGAIRVAPAPPALPSFPTWPWRLSEGEMTERPSLAQIEQLHPPRARQRDQVGAVVLEGRVVEGGSLIWRVVATTPFGWGFEDAAIRVGRLYRAPASFPDGRSTVGASFFCVVGFTRTPPEPRYYY